MSATAAQPRQAPKMLEQIGRYRIQSELGRGAMGVVYRARDPVIDREVAIKTIRVDLPRDELARFEARFFTEIRAAGRLSHPNIVTVHDAGREGGLVYVTMELLEGPSLADLLAAHTPVPAAKIASIGAQVADALAYAHAQGIVHRDVKPANIILVRDRTPKLTDFGVARLPSAASTLAGTLVGSPKYMSPEQVTAQTVDGRSDVFSLGVVLYELLTGEAAFGADDMHAVMHRVVTHTPPAPATLNPRVPPALDRIVCRAIAKRPEDRYASARALAADLTRFVRGEPVVDAARSTTTAAPASQPSAPAPGEETLELRPRNPVPPAGDAPVVAHARRKHTLAAIAASILLAATAGGWMLHAAKAPPNTASANGSVAATAPVEVAAVAPPAIDAPIDRGAVATSAPAADPPASGTPDARAASRAAERPVAPRPRATATDTPTPAARVPAPKAAEPAVAAAPAAVRPAEAKVLLAIAPWGEVYVDGQRMGVTPPLNELTVPAGRRKIEIRNTDLKPHVVMLDLHADSAVKIKHQFK